MRCDDSSPAFGIGDSLEYRGGSRAQLSNRLCGDSRRGTRPKQDERECGDPVETIHRETNLICL